MKTDVLGVYDRPPSEPNAVLLREIGKMIKDPLDVILNYRSLRPELTNSLILQLWVKMVVGLFYDLYCTTVIQKV